MMLLEPKKDIFSQLIKEATRDELLWMNGFLSGVLSSEKDYTGNVSGNNIAAKPKIEKLTILYATETGNAKSLATKFAATSKKIGIKTKLTSVEQYRLSDLQKEEYFFVVISTQGDGEPPLAAAKFFNAIHEGDLILPKLKYGVLALGDSSYPLFCQAGEDVDKQLELRGARRVVPLQKCDTDYDEVANNWFESHIVSLNASQPSNSAAPAIIKKSSAKKIYNGRVITNFNLNDKDSHKETHHIEIEAEDIEYTPGDALGVVPENPIHAIEEILHLSGLQANTKVVWKDSEYEIFDLLKNKLQIIYLHERVVNKYALVVGQEIPETRMNLTDLLKIYPVKNTDELLQVIQILEPIVPRLYSISSSPEAHGGEVHITVARDKFLVNEKEEVGLCSHYLTQLPIDTNLNFYIHPNKVFRMPSEYSDVIMIGPGTGVAPFRSFLFERDAQGASGKNWLFFGDQHFTSDFLYQTEIQSFLDSGVLTKFNGAFSRDQEHKVYVQHKMLQEAEELFEWLETGAYIYICGAKEPMSFDVEKTLVEIIATQKHIDESQAVAYIENMREAGRLLKDVY